MPSYFKAIKRNEENSCKYMDEYSFIYVFWENLTYIHTYTVTQTFFKKWPTYVHKTEGLLSFILIIKIHYYKIIGNVCDSWQEVYCLRTCKSMLVDYYFEPIFKTSNFSVYQFIINAITILKINSNHYMLSYIYKRYQLK